jgi:HTH-type transcriptional repressor of NAD biosynthesis genes
MVKAFVFGKFLPFHKGHEAMIRFALSKCDFLTVLVCSSDRENISGATRKKWIEQTFRHEKNVEVRIFDYFEAELPNTSATSEAVSEIWSIIFKKQFPNYSLLVTSEGYGSLVAAYMHIEHISFDIDRSKFPVSATAVRKDLFGNWNFLPDAVKLDFALKVVLLGTESTGKSTMTEMLSAHFKCNKVMEAARDIIPNSTRFELEDLYVVASEHASIIDYAVLGESPLVIIDTDIHITKSYGRFMFDMDMDVDAGIYASNKANLYLYLNNDVPYDQDGTRLSEEERNLLDCSHRCVLRDHNIGIVEVSGNWDARFELAVAQINKLIAAY